MYQWVEHSFYEVPTGLHSLIHTIFAVSKSSFNLADCKDEGKFTPICVNPIFWDLLKAAFKEQTREKLPCKPTSYSIVSSSVQEKPSLSEGVFSAGASIHLYPWTNGWLINLSSIGISLPPKSFPTHLDAGLSSTDFNTLTIKQLSLLLYLFRSAIVYKTYTDHHFCDIPLGNAQWKHHSGS